jgi:hypothetical protein
LLFDVGGVLVELNGMETLLDWLGPPAVTVDELWVRWLRSKAVREFETGLIDPAEFAVAVTREFGLKVEPDAFLDSFAGWPIGLYPGAMNMLARIPTRYRRALLSNSNALHWPRVSNGLRGRGRIARVLRGAGAVSRRQHAQRGGSAERRHARGARTRAARSATPPGRVRYHRGAAITEG